MSHPAHFSLNRHSPSYGFNHPLKQRNNTPQPDPVSRAFFTSKNDQTMNKLPFRVTLLYWLVLTITAWNGLRLWTALAWRNTLNEFSTQPTATIIAISGAVWMIIGIILIWSIWQKKAWSAKLLLGAAAGYTVWYWSERFIWQNPHPNWLFAVIVNLALLIFILFTAKLLTREAHERNNENPKIE